MPLDWIETPVEFTPTRVTQIAGPGTLVRSVHESIPGAALHSTHLLRLAFVGSGIRFVAK